MSTAMAPPSAPGSTNSSNVYQLKILVQQSKPPIWRRIEILDNINFRQLHHAIQKAMHGWMDYHLHQFKFGSSMAGYTILAKDDDDTGLLFEDYGVTFDESHALVRDHLKTVGQSCVYEYDFGDGWNHKITLEKISPRAESIQYPRIISGKRACPIEDSGSIYGFMEKLETLKNPSDPEYEEIHDWVLTQSIIQRDGRSEFDPAYFRKESVTFD